MKNKKSLLITHPQIARQWHPTKNGDLTPDQVVAGSNKKVWWKCPKGPDHEWPCCIYHRTGLAKSGCPFCNGKKVSVTNSLVSLNPEIAAEWHPTKNGNLTPDQIVAGSNKRYWWKCIKGPDHEWKTTVASRTGKSKRSCPCCAFQKVSVTNSLAMLFPKIAAEWHPTKNGDLVPEQVISGSNKRYWWKCNKGPDHEWKTAVGNRTHNKSNCPCCAGKKVSVTNSLQALIPEIAAEWHPTKNGVLTPQQVVARSGKKVWWKCTKGPDHEWKTIVASRTHNESNCPCCSGQKVSVTNSLQTLFPEISAEWHPTKNGILTPEQIVAHARKKVWWKCQKDPDHEWKAAVYSRTDKSKIGCPSCAEYGFNPKKSALLYYIRIDVPIRKKPLYKIGITNNEVEYRIKSMGIHEDVNITVLYKQKYTRGANARRRELQILEQNSTYKYRGKAVLKSGHTEMFTRDVLRKDT